MSRNGAGIGTAIILLLPKQIPAALTAASPGNFAAVRGANFLLAPVVPTAIASSRGSIHTISVFASPGTAASSLFRFHSRKKEQVRPGRRIFCAIGKRTKSVILALHKKTH